MFKTQWYKEELQNSDSDIKHRSLSEEYSFFEAVKDGNIEFVQKNCQEKAFINPEGMGILSKNSLTNLKYHFVITVALITRYCIDGGMETEQAYRLSDFYILHMDTCQSMKEISELHDVMAHDFTGKMRLLQKNAALSKPIAQCIDYIYAHISSRITVDELASYTGLSISQGFLSRISVFRSVIIFAKKKSKKHRIFYAFPILATLRLPIICPSLRKVTLSRHLNIISA